MTTTRPPMRQVAALWFAAGIGVAACVGFFFDSRQGSARRHMAYDKATSAGRRVGRWSGKKARHWRNKAVGTAARMRPSDDDRTEVAGGSR